MNISKDTSIGEVVAEDYRTASIFESAGIDYSCKGKRSIDEACNNKGIETNELINDLQHIIKHNAPPSETLHEYKDWPLDKLTDHIEEKHHKYVTKQIPIIKGLLDQIIESHGNRHPELKEIKSLFSACAGEFSVHMKKEELTLFPRIRKIAKAVQSGDNSAIAAMGNIENSIKMMMHDHDKEFDQLRRVGELSNQYTPPADGDKAYKDALDNLKAFEDDLHLHIHLENNILFPKSVALVHSVVQ